MRKNLYDLYLGYLCTVYGVNTLRRAVELSGGKEALFEEYDENSMAILGMRPTEEGVRTVRTVRSEAFLETTAEEAGKKGIRFVTEEEEAYPARLFDVKDRPFVLFYRGRLPDDRKPAVSVIGSRKCSLYGKEAAFRFSEAFAGAGLNVVSGMAFGVDGHAGRGAASVPGASFAVLGSGPDVCYPRENLDLFEALKANGGILSERPPGYYPKPYDFPIRNRLISGLSDVVAVIEAAENSGSLITVNYALEQNRTVFALPGRITDRQAAGTNRLLKEGAEVLTCPEDVLQFLGVSVKKDSVFREKKELTGEERAVLKGLEREALSVESLLVLTGFPVPLLLETLVKLEVKGVVRKEADGRYTAEL